MICFRDRTYCGNTFHADDCPRPWNDELQAAADRWWGKPGAPVCFGSLCNPHAHLLARENGGAK